MKFSLIVLTIMTFSILAHALEHDDAWVRKAQFDGQFYTYEIVAYGAASFKEEKEIKCNYGYFGKDKVLKSIDVKLVIAGDFQPVNTYSSHTGKIDVGAEIQSCIETEKDVNKNIESPVALNFPKISVSSRLTTFVPPKPESFTQCVERVTKQCQGDDCRLFYRPRQCDGLRDK